MRILLLRLREIGDVVFTTPAVHALRTHYPDAHITYLVEPPAAPVVAGSSDIDEVIVAPRVRGLQGTLGDLRLAGRLRERAFDLAIDFHGGPRASLLAWLSGARERVGYTVPGRGWMYTRRIPRVRTPRGRHSVINQWALLEAAGIPPSALTTHDYPVRMDASEAARDAAAARLASARVLDSDRLVVMHVSAGNPFRRWPAESFAHVAAALARGAPDRRIVVTSGPSDASAAGTVIEAARGLLAPSERDRVLACGDFSLAELRALCERASLYIGGDSGPLHIASTSRVPIVALFGPTLPERSAPWRSESCRAEFVQVDGLPCRPCDQRRCEPGDFRCLTGIDPGRVVEASERLLDAGAVQ
jgi:lipopolysaccharide heptosyltransferase II